MSRSLNKVMLIGNLGGDPEVRSTSNGSRVASFSLATSRQWTSQGGEKQEKTEWHKIVVWNNKFSTLADIVEKYLKKGDRVYVEGSIEYRTFEGKDGQTKYMTEINVRELVMLTGKSDGGPGAGGETGGRRSAAPAATAAGKKDAKQGKEGSTETFDDFPEALDEEDDDLPF